LASVKKDNAKGKTKPRLLLVESYELIRDIFRELFENHGYYIIAADTAKDGLKILNDECFDIVICDFDLHDSTGIEFFESTKNICQDRTNVLMITYGDLVNITEEEILNIHHIIEKPFSFEKLLRIVEGAPKNNMIT
jgi:two-component system, NtrC family, nitrogen regulation response regulator NtrX